jgi:hypothetical protein
MRAAYTRLSAEAPLPLFSDKSQFSSHRTSDVAFERCSDECDEQAGGVELNQTSGGREQRAPVLTLRSRSRRVIG